MRRFLTLSCVLVAAAIAFVALTARRPAAAHAEAETHTVIIEGMKFVPETLTVKSGDSVVWANKDLFPHTATSEEGGFDSQQIAANESWRHTFGKKGEFPYVCTLHPTMKAAITVK